MRKIWIMCLVLVVTLPLLAQSNPEIISFTYDGIPLIYDEVEQGIAASDFSWEAINVTDDYQMMMHAYVGGQWALIGEGFAPAKSDRLVVAHPLSFSLPSYRLSIVDSDGEIVDEAHLRLPYAETDSDGDAEIVSFETESTSVSRQALINNRVELDVSWEVLNRIVSTNLLFEQVLPNGTFHPIELPRFENWVRSVSDGVVAPINVAGENQITLQIRLVNIVTDETLSTNQITVPINNDVTRAEPTMASIPTDEPLGQYLSLNAPRLVTLGDSFTLSWDASAAEALADEVVIREWHQIDYTGAYGEIPILLEEETKTPENEWSALPLSSEMIVDAPSEFPPSHVPHHDYQNVVIFALYLRQNGEFVYQNGSIVRVGPSVYLRTVEDATTCIPFIDIPEQVKSDEVFTVSWDLCGVPSARIEYPRNDVIVWGMHPRFTPMNPGSFAFKVSLFPDQTEYDVIFTISSIFSDARVEGHCKGCAPIVI